MPHLDRQNLHGTDVGAVMSEAFTFSLSVVCRAMRDSDSLKCRTCGQWMHNTLHVSDHWRKGHFSIIPEGGFNDTVLSEAENPAEITSAKFENVVSVGMFRIPWQRLVEEWDRRSTEVNPFDDFHTTCSCGELLHNLRMQREHWQLGHYDEPVYEKKTRKRRNYTTQMRRFERRLSLLERLIEESKSEGSVM